MKLNKKQKKEVRDLLDKIDWEGGILEYFTSYSSPESFAEDFPFLPQELKDAVKEMAKQVSIVENHMNALESATEED